MKKIFKGLTLIALILFLYSGGSVNEKVSAAQTAIANYSPTGLKLGPLLIGNAMRDGNDLFTFTLKANNVTNPALCVAPGKHMTHNVTYKYVREFKSANATETWQNKAYTARLNAANENACSKNDKLKNIANCQSKMILATQLVAWYAKTYTDDNHLKEAIQGQLSLLFPNDYTGKNASKYSTDAQNIFTYIKNRNTKTYYLYIYNSCSSETDCEWQPLITKTPPPPETHDCDEVKENGTIVYYGKNNKKLGSGENARAQYIKACFNPCESLDGKISNGSGKYTNPNNVEKEAFNGGPPKGCRCTILFDSTGKKEATNVVNYLDADGNKLGKGDTARNAYVRSCFDACAPLTHNDVPSVPSGKTYYTSVNNNYTTNTKLPSGCKCRYDESNDTYYGYDGTKITGNSKDKIIQKYVDDCSCVKKGTNLYLGPSGSQTNFAEYKRLCSCVTGIIDIAGRANYCKPLKSDGTKDCTTIDISNEIANLCACRVENNKFYGPEHYNTEITPEKYVEVCGCFLPNGARLADPNVEKRFNDAVANTPECGRTPPPGGNPKACQKGEINGETIYYLKDGSTSKVEQDFFNSCNPSCAEIGINAVIGIYDKKAYGNDFNPIYPGTKNTTSSYGWNSSHRVVSYTEWMNDPECNNPKNKKCIVDGDTFIDKDGNSSTSPANFIKACGCNLNPNSNPRFTNASQNAKQQYIDGVKNEPTCNYKCEIIEDENGNKVYYNYDGDKITGDETTKLRSYLTSCNPACKQIDRDNIRDGFDRNGDTILDTNHQYYDFNYSTNVNDPQKVFGYNSLHEPVDKEYYDADENCNGGGGGYKCGDQDEDGNWIGPDGMPSSATTQEEINAICNGNFEYPSCNVDILGNPATCDPDDPNNNYNYGKLYQVVTDKESNPDCKPGYTQEGDGYYGEYQSSAFGGSNEYCKLYCLSEYEENYPGKIDHTINIGRFIVWPNNSNDTEEKIKYGLETYPLNMSYKKTCRVQVDRNKVMQQFQSADALKDALKEAVKDTPSGKPNPYGGKAQTCKDYNNSIDKFIDLQSELAYEIPDPDTMRYYLIETKCYKHIDSNENSQTSEHYEFDNSEFCNQMYDEYKSKFVQSDMTWTEYANDVANEAIDAFYMEAFYRIISARKSDDVSVGYGSGNRAVLSIIKDYLSYLRSEEGAYGYLDQYPYEFYKCEGVNSGFNTSKLCGANERNASYVNTCLKAVWEKQEEGIEINSSFIGDETKVYGAVAKDEVISELNRCIPIDSDISVDFTAQPTISYDDPEYGKSYQAVKSGENATGMTIVDTSTGQPSNNIGALQGTNLLGSEIFSWINRLENLEYSKSKTATYDLEKNVFDNIYVEDGKPVSSTTVDDNKKPRINLEFSTLPISMNAVSNPDNDDHKYHLKVEANISTGDSELDSMINSRDYTCKYEVTKKPDCYCPENTEQNGKNLSSYILGHHVTCAQAQYEDCGEKKTELYCIDKDGIQISCGEETNQERCNEKCFIDKCPEDSDYKGKMTEQLKQCQASGGNFADCVKTVCYKKECDTNICPDGDDIPRCPYDDPSIPESNRGMDISTCVEPAVASGVPLAQAYEDCKDATCPGNRIIYRVIDLTNPFPSVDADDYNTISIYKTPNVGDYNDDIRGRYPGYNWKSEIVVKSKIINNRKVNDDDVYNKNPIYSFTLTPQVMKDIRRYNDEQAQGYSDFTLNCSMNGNAACKLSENFKGRLGVIGGDCANATGSDFYTCRYSN